MPIGDCPPGAEKARRWWLDGVGNWKQTEQRDPFNADSFDTRGVTSFNEYTVAAGATLDYDDNGNLMNDEKNLHYHWDAFNRLHRVTDANDATTATYTYDTDGRRLMKDLAGTANDVSVAYDGWQIILEYAGAAGLPLRQYTYGAFINEPLFMDVADGNGEFLDEGDSSPLERYSYLQTPIYNVAALVDCDTQELVERYDYDPYGKYTLIVGDTRTELGESLVGNSMTFTGHWFDRETGMYWMKHRVYNSHIGSFISKDPASQGSLYLYCGSSPISQIDSNGLWYTNVHKDLTTKWANENAFVDKKYAEIIGVEDDRVDTTYPPDKANSLTDQNLGWHFNRSQGGDDSRIRLSDNCLGSARYYCAWWHNQGTDSKHDDPDKASIRLGKGLHALQDIVAHGDYMLYADIPHPSAIHLPPWKGWHNKFSPQRIPRTFWREKYPDNIELDAAGSATGIPDYAALTQGQPNAGYVQEGPNTYRWVLYETGIKRKTLTQNRTVEYINKFREWVEEHSKPCGKCREMFKQK